MRYITKAVEPPTLGHIRASLQRTPGLLCDLYTNHLNSSTRQEILDNCLREQQGLCAYTGMDASNGKGHIEHLTPRSVSCPKKPPDDLSPRPYETISWENLVACFPENPSGWPYGAGRKDHWPSDAERHEFVSPLNPTCQARFRYGHQGTIRATDPDDTAATNTIKKLALDHNYLTEARKAVLDVDKRTRDPAKRRQLLARLEDRTTSQAPVFAFQRSQALRRLWAGTI